MWMETLPDGRFKYIERYKDPYTEKYKRKSVILTSNSKQAQKKAQKILEDKIKNSLNLANQSDILFASVFNEWYERSKRSFRPSTQRAYESQKKIIFNKLDGTIKIRNIDHALLQSFFDGLDYSKSYLVAIKAELNQMFKYAKKMGYIVDNPMADVELISKAKTLADIQKIENKYLEQDEAEALIKELYRRKSSYRIGRLAEFMYLTGVRNGEAVILRPSDFDLDNRIVHITGTINPGASYRNAVKGPPKTAKSLRDIELTPRCIKLIERTIDENKLSSLTTSEYLEGDYLFVSKTGIPLQNSSINTALKAAGKRIGLDHKHLTTHIFRHSHISKLAELGVPIAAVMNRVGHESEAVTNQIYTHITKNMRTTTIDKLTKSGL